MIEPLPHSLHCAYYIKNACKNGNFKSKKVKTFKKYTY